MRRLTRGPAHRPRAQPSAVSARGRRSLPGPDADVSTQLPISARQSPLTRPSSPAPSKLQLHPEIPGGIKMAGWIPAHTGSHTAAPDGMLGPETADCVHQQTCFKQALPVNRAGCPGSLPVAFHSGWPRPAPDSLRGHIVSSRGRPQGPVRQGPQSGVSPCSQQLRGHPCPISLKLLGPGEGVRWAVETLFPYHVNGLSHSAPERAAMGRWAVVSAHR